MLITFPAVYGIDYSIKGNPVRQIAADRSQREGVLAPFTRGRLSGFVFQPGVLDEEVLIVPPEAKRLPDGHQRILRATPDPDAEAVDLTDGTWLRHPLRHVEEGQVDHERQIAECLESWIGAFSYVQEDPQRQIVGLRNPQLGALHAIHAHWSITNATATVVMPTGTGKTEVMLAILVSYRCPKLLVVAPTDALRAQLAEKFATLGVLKVSGCTLLKANAKHPVVCILHHIPSTPDEVDYIFARSHVIVTTSMVAGQSLESVQNRMAQHCPYFFIDEAHHAEAPTWVAFKEKFKERRIVQFTATPFREDGKPLDGDIIYKYPLKKAQEEGYFKPIRFEHVVAFNRKKADQAIAAKAMERLRADADKGHILMARAENVARATEIFKLYKPYAEFHPVELHTGIKSITQREKIRRQIITGQSKIVVCVDMLGEGFDLPALKIAAFHDIRKTLAVTLQLAGRFTRARPDLGDATFIANTADVEVQDELRKLYTRDPDWNVLLPQLSDRMIGEQMSLQDFLRGFTEFTKEIPLKTVRPAASCVVYKTTCQDWAPENFREGIPGIDSCEQVHETINHHERTLIVVTARRVPLDWTDVQTLYSWDWELYVIIWSPEQNLLYINGSTNAGEYKALAKAVAGETAALIKGNDVFRTFHGVNRLVLQQVGLTEILGRNVRYTGRMGGNVGPGVPDAQRRRTLKSVLSGTGYKDGEKLTIAGSRKGRIWSHRRERVDQLAGWCKEMGAKLLDETIDPDQVLAGTLESQTLVVRPAKMPIGVDWPEQIYTTPEGPWSIVIGDEEFPLSEMSIDISSPSRDGALRLVVSSENKRGVLGLELYEEDEAPNYRFLLQSDERVQIKRGGRAEPDDISDFFYDNPPVIWFADGSALEGNQYVELKNMKPPYDAAKIQAWDWTGTDIQKESQGTEKRADSVQARVIRELRTRDYNMIIDDDGKGEVADVVTIRIQGELTAPTGIDVEFYHCKYSGGAEPGQRLDDLYEVCGQAQKSIRWMSSHEKRSDLFTHLLRREAIREEAGLASRYEVGDTEMLQMIREMSHLCQVKLKIHIVQPGLSKARVTSDQLELLSVTENHLTEIYELPFTVIASS
jgi:superfamily II DNA or RNA helicase